MKIVGFILNKVLIERKNPVKGKLEIKAGLNIANIKQEENSLSDKASLRFEFVYTVDYAPDVAKLEIDGAIITLDEKDESKELLKSWKDKKIPDSLRLPLFNFIMEKCNVKAIQLEDEIGLPIHIPMPKLGIKPQDSKDTKESKDKKEKEKNPANYAG
jgi:hypothetical protein